MVPLTISVDGESESGGFASSGNGTRNDDAGGTGRGDIGIRHVNAELRGADVGGGECGSVPRDGRAGTEIGAIDGQQEIPATVLNV